MLGIVLCQLRGRAAYSCEDLVQFIRLRWRLRTIFLEVPDEAELSTEGVEPDGVGGVTEQDDHPRAVTYSRPDDPLFEPIDLFEQHVVVHSGRR